PFIYIMLHHSSCIHYSTSFLFLFLLFSLSFSFIIIFIFMFLFYCLLVPTLLMRSIRMLDTNMRIAFFFLIRYFQHHIFVDKYAVYTRLLRLLFCELQLPVALNSSRIVEFIFRDPTIMLRCKTFPS